MYNPLRITLFLALALSARLAGTGPSTPAAPVAIVCYVEGSATLRATADTPSEPLALFRRLAPGAVVETAAKSTVTIVFFDGQRLALGPAARAVVGRKGLTTDPHRVHRLAPVPAVVALAPLLRDGAPRRRTPAVRIRGNGDSTVVSGLHPQDGLPVLRAPLTLSFNLVPNVMLYHLAVEDERGRTVFSVDVPTPPVPLPRRLLRPGSFYSWHVEPKVPRHPEMRGEAVFLTLDERLERAREALAGEASRSAEPDLAQLLAEIDRTLGLKESEHPS